MKKYFNLPHALLLTISLTSTLCAETALVDLSTRLLKGLPEFIGYNSNQGVFNEMKAFYPSTQAWNNDPFTLKSNELSAAFDSFIQGFRNDVNYNDANKWVNKTPPPSSLFDTAKNPRVIAYPYIQKVVVPTGSTLLFIGDTHASPQSFLRILWRWFLNGFMDSSLKLKPNYYVVITGDYVDFGNGGSEMWYLLVTLKLQNWNNVFMLRGNHELWTLDNLSTLSTFVNELDFKFGETERELLKNKIKCAYNLLPHALLIGTANDFIICAHGGVDATYSAQHLLEPGNFYDHLTAVQNFLYAATLYDGVLENRFIGRLYSNYPATMPIETDVNALTTQYSSEDIKTRLIFRGHQHSSIPECFCFIKKGYPVGTNPITTVLPGWQAANNVSYQDQLDISLGTFNLNDSDYYPLYTLFSATGNSTRFDCFGSVSTAADFFQWKFKLYQRNLDTNQTYLRDFARFDLRHRNEIRTVYSSDQKPFNNPLSDNLIKLATA